MKNSSPRTAVRARLEEAEETLWAIRNHEADALVVEGPGGDQVYTLHGAEHPYRVLVETVSEGALTMTPDGAVLILQQPVLRACRTVPEQDHGCIVL